MEEKNIIDSDRGENLTLTWENLKVVINEKKKTGFCSSKIVPKTIIDNVSGYAQSGECLAIIGGSGAGKSTLLNLISDKFVKEKNFDQEGEVFLGTKKMDFSVYKKQIGFVMQADYFLENLTVREYFKFAVDLKKSHLNNKEKENEVNELLRILKLEKAADTIVGGNLRKGISGGEKKRLNIGFELLSDPNILFLDEPTSGLDSYTSYVIVKLLKKLAREKNMIIVYTIHQPSTDIFILFDNLLILNEGKNVYFGKAEKVLDYFKEIGYQCPDDQNPMDYYIDLVKKSSPETLDILYNEFNSSTNPQIIDFVQNKKEGEMTKINKYASCCTQFGVLFKRAFFNFIRNKFAIPIRIFQIVFIAVLFILIFNVFPQDVTDPKATFNRLGGIYLLILNNFISFMQNVLLTFPAERVVYAKEYNSGLYGVTPYYFSKILIELPFVMILPWLFIGIIYYVVKFNSDIERFFLLGGCIVCICLLGNMWGIFLGAAIPNPKLALQFAPLVFVPFLLFSGYTTNTSNIGDYLKWLEYISPFRYGFEWAVWNEFDGTDFNPNPIQTLNFTLGIKNCFFIMAGYIVFMIFLCLLVLKLNTRVVKN
jgi:ABC-type multidrug transport system ATPase subunit/ABC-type multidrug transport system permease subunit